MYITVSLTVLFAILSALSLPMFPLCALIQHISSENTILPGVFSMSELDTTNLDVTDGLASANCAAWESLNIFFLLSHLFV